jgi:hypothetical protein
MNKTINKLIVTGPNYEQFLQDNIIDGKLDFSILVPVPENVTEQYDDLRFGQLDNDELIFTYEMHDDGFYFKPDIGFWMLANEFDYVGWKHVRNSFHYWAIDIWGPCKNRPIVNVQHIDDGAIVRFITIYDGPSKWSTSLPQAYPDLDFHIHSLSSRGLYAHEYIRNNEMVCAIDSYISPSEFSKLDCYLKV